MATVPLDKMRFSSSTNDFDAPVDSGSDKKMDFSDTSFDITANGILLNDFNFGQGLPNSATKNVANKSIKQPESFLSSFNQGMESLDFNNPNEIPLFTPSYENISMDFSDIEESIDFPLSKEPFSLLGMYDGRGVDELVSSLSKGETVLG